MRFNGMQCVSCKNTFTENDDVVVCPTCGSPHHRDCWLNEGKCANSALHEEGFVWKMPEENSEKPEEKKEAPEITETEFRFKNGEKAILCPYCSTVNYGNDAFCMKCRRPFVQTDSFAPNNGEPEQYQMNNDTLFFYQSLGGLRPETEIDGIPVLEYADYIGEKKSGRYIRKFATMDRYSRKASFSICAFLFGPIWYFYRKLFKEGVVYLLISLILTGVYAWGSYNEPTKLMYEELGTCFPAIMSGEMSLEEYNEYITELEEKYSKYELSKTDKIKTAVANISYMLNLGVMLAFALAADYFYQRKIKKEILQTRTECQDMFTYRQALRLKGSVSVGGAAIAAALSLILYFLPLIPAYTILFDSIM